MGSNKNTRIVLPQSSCPPQRRVIAPTSLSKPSTRSSQQTTSLPSQNGPHSTSQSELSKPVSAEKYKEYLEDMELKIRYMKNDIEFKQSQIQSKELLSSASHLHRPVLRTNGLPVHRKQAFSSIRATKLPAKVTSKPVYKSASQGYSSHIIPHFTQVKKPHSSLTKVNNTLSSELKHTQAQTYNGSTSVTQVSSLHKHLNVPLLSTSTSMSATTHTISKPPQVATSKESIPSAVINLQPCSTASTSVFQRLGTFTSVSSPKPVYVSPSKNQAIWSRKLDQSAVCSLAKRRADLSAELSNFNAAKVPKIMNGNSEEACRSGSVISGPAVPINPYKLVKTCVPPVMVSAPSIMAHSLQTFQNSFKTCSNIPGKHNLSPTHNKTVIKKTPKLKVSAKIVSKYKMTRLSPTSTFKLAPKLCMSQATQQASLLTQSSINEKCNIHKLDRRLAKTQSQKDFNTSTQTKLPKLEIVMAAKLVSKYRLKRLSPTSTSNVAPSLLRSRCMSSMSAHSSTPFLPKRQLSNRGASDSMSKKILFDTSWKNLTPHKKFVHNGHKGNVCLRRNTFVVDRRSSANAGLKSKSIPVGNRLKLDRRPGQAVASVNSSRSPARTTQRRRSKHHWVSSTVNPSKSTSACLTSARKQQAIKSRFKWKRSSSGGPNGIALNHSQFKWSKQRHFAHPSILGSGKGWPPLKNHSDMWLPRSNLVMIRGVVYRSNWQAPSYKMNDRALRDSSRTNHKLITVRGAQFHADSRGKKLRRAGLVNNLSKSEKEESSQSNKDQGKTVDETVILAASRVVHRSMAVAAAKFRKDAMKWKRKKQHCIFFGRFGKCHRGDQCQYVHDPEKVAVCTRFLRGKCGKTRCQFSHHASVHKMPVCLHYLQGLCSRDNCPYLHVRVNPNAPVCKDFHNGFCALGEKCKKLHSLVCPSFAVTGQCSRGESCSLLHRRINRERAGQKSHQTTSRRHRKRRKSSAIEAGPSKKCLREPTCTESGPLSKTSQNTSLETAGCGLTGSHQSSNAVLEISASQIKDSNAQTESKGETLKRSDSSIHPADVPDITTCVASPKKSSAPLASQPSFISLLSESESSKRYEACPSDTDHTRKSVQAPCIKPLFVAQRLAQSEVSQDQTSLSKANLPALSIQALKSNLENHTQPKPVPRPAFLLRRDKHNKT